MKIKWGRLIWAIIICQMAGLIGFVFTSAEIPNWYVTLVKPSFSPPSYLFGPVWTILYTLMGISLYLIWEKREVVEAFFVQLIFNAVWSIIFFGLKNIGLALIEILILWFLIVRLLVKTYKVQRTAFYLLVPYFIWVSFATILNFSFFLLNR